MLGAVPLMLLVWFAAFIVQKLEGSGHSLHAEHQRGIWISSIAG